MTIVRLLARAATLAPPVAAQDNLVFATDWLAQTEHGGSYQAVAERIYSSTDSTCRSRSAVRR